MCTLFDISVAFSGGYLSVEWPRSQSNSNNFKKISLDFKPTSEVGVLFFIEFHSRAASENGSSEITMLSYNHSSLIFSVQPKEQPTLYKYSVLSNSNNEISLTSNNNLQMQIRNKELRIRFNSAKRFTHSFKSRVDVKKLLFGGTEDFTTYYRFPVRNYFVGILTNFYIGHDCVSLAERNKLNGNQTILQDNCTTAIPSFVEFNAFSLPLTSVAVQPTSHLRISFTLAAKHCVGDILHLSGGSFRVRLSARKLITTISNSSGHSTVCTSNGVIDQSKWIDVRITYVNNTIRYFIDNEEKGSCHVDLVAVSFSGRIMVGASRNMSIPFIGHLRHLYWDNSEINLVGLATAEQQSCVGIGPPSCNSSEFNTTFSLSCSTCVMRDLPIQWDAFDVSVLSNLTVGEDDGITIKHNHFTLSYAGSQCLTNTNLHKLYKNINFTLQVDPAHGTLSIHQFTFYNVYNNEVYYTPAEEGSDVLHLQVQVHCGSRILYRKSMKLYINVISTNDSPPLLHLKDINMVVGTRRLITQDIILMHDKDTSLELLRCIDSKVHGQGGMKTGQFEQIDKPGYEINQFYQHEIDAGKIVLRLFLNGTGTSTVALTVYDNNTKNHRNFKVNGISGTITLMINTSVDVLKNHSVSIDKSHLVAGTNFAYQNPIVTFILIKFPEFGELLLVHNQSFVNRNVSHFTQHDVDNGKLFYSHTIPIKNSTKDCFTFKLMVDDFKGDSGTFCVDVLIEDHLPKLVLNVIAPHNITLLEGGEKLISNNDLVITSGLKWLSGQMTSLPDDVFILLLFMQLPKYGNLYLNNSNGTRTFVSNNISLEQLADGLLVYSHEVEEEHQDSFRIILIAQNISHLYLQSSPVSSMGYVVHIDITPINNKYPQIQIYANLVLTEGSREYLTTDIINITDADRPAENLNIYVSPKVASNGRFASRENTTVAISKFSVKELIEGHIVFIHELGTELEEDYIIIVSDGLHNSSSVRQN